MITIIDGKKSIRLEEFDMRPLRNHTRPRSGKITYRSQHIDGRMGDWYFGAEIGPKTYGLQANTLIQKWDNLEERLDQLTAFLFDSKGNPKLLKCKWDNTEKFAFVRLAEAITPDVSTILEKIPIQFINYDSNEYAESDAYDLNQPLKYDAGNEYGSKAYPNTQSFTWNIVPNHYAGIENYSYLDTPIKITIKGTVKGGSIKHLESGNAISFPDVTNGTVVIDTETYNISVNGSDILEFDGEFFEMSNGSNGFQFSAEQANATVTFDWVHKFM